MRKLGEQWVEELDGKMHMLKAVEGGSCSGCVFYDWYEGHLCKSKPARVCGGFNIIIKDLGILNEQGCLPAPWDKAIYPQVYRTTEVIWYAYAESYGIFMEAKGKTKQEAIDVWNRRA